jgi:hypothetical protein
MLRLPESSGAVNVYCCFFGHEIDNFAEFTVESLGLPLCQVMFTGVRTTHNYPIGSGDSFRCAGIWPGFGLADAVVGPNRSRAIRGMLVHAL